MTDAHPCFIPNVVLFVDVGKAGKHLSQGAEIGRQHKSHSLHEYEILVGDPRAIRWVETRGVPNPQNFGARHVEVGVDVSGHQIFIAQVNHNGGTHPARASGSASGTFRVFFGGGIWPLRILTSFPLGAYLVYGDGELAFQVSVVRFGGVCRWLNLPLAGVPCSLLCVTSKSERVE